MSITKPATRTPRDTWVADAACAELPTAVFFPTDAVGDTVALCVCAACPVRDLCLEYALANGIEHGVWGGTTATERSRMLAQGHSPSAAGL